MESQVEPVIKLPDAGVRDLPPARCGSDAGAGRGEARPRSARRRGSACGAVRCVRCGAAQPSPRTARIRSPGRRFKCQRCRKRAPGGSPRVLARPARPAGPRAGKPSRAQPCLWADAPPDPRPRRGGWDADSRGARGRRSAASAARSGTAPPRGQRRRRRGPARRSPRSKGFSFRS